MDFKTFLENFDAIAEAPGGIPKLRSLILDLAVRGKLVPQNSEDEPASIILEKIRFEKEQLRTSKQTKLNKALPKIERDTLLFEAPLGWEWCYITDISQKVTDGEHATPQRSSSGYYLLSARNVRDEGIILNDVDYVPEEEFLRIRKRCDPDKGDILISCSGSVGRITVVDKDKAYVMVRSVALIKPFQRYVFSKFLAYALRAAPVQSQIIEKSRASAQANLFLGKIKEIKIPLPPLAEQKQIVEKVDELMGLCDRYEAAKQTRDNLRQKLRGSAIASLMNAETDEELDAAWAFVRDNWHNLSQHPEDVDGLRKSVLQLAARGKLVPQEPRDESANQLLQKAIQEKALMAQAGLIPKPKQSSPISEDDCPFSLPSSWAWVRLENICSHIVDCLHRTPKYQAEGYPAIRTSEMQPGKILFDQARKVGREEYELQTQRLVPKAGDIFYSREGNFGIAAVVPEGVEICLSQRMMQFRPVSEVNPDFFSWIINSSAMYEQAARDVVGMTVPHVNIRSLKEFIFPLAPYAEQKRIVAKVDELMQLCDQLEASLRQSQQRAESLAASAISHLTI